MSLISPSHETMRLAAEAEKRIQSPQTVQPLASIPAGTGQPVADLPAGHLSEDPCLSAQLAMGIAA